MSRAAAIPNDLLSNYDLMYMLDVRVQRIYWHRRKNGLPFHSIPGTSRCPATRYSLKEILAWAKKRKIEVKRTPVIKSDGTIVWSPKDQKKFKAFQQGIEL